MHRTDMCTQVIRVFERVKLTWKGEGIFSVQVAMAKMVVHTGMIGWKALATSGPAQYTPRIYNSCMQRDGGGKWESRS